jgi:hypothetical protein
MSFVNTPLGDSLYENIGDVMTNTFGETHPVHTDLLGGDAANHIVDPEVDFRFPDNWGAAPDLLPYVPARPIQQCCTVVTPRDEVPESVPEPASFLLVAAVLLAGLMRRRFAR